jgi:hypothetical protein
MVVARMTTIVIPNHLPLIVQPRHGTRLGRSKVHQWLVSSAQKVGLIEYVLPARIDPTTTTATMVAISDVQSLQPNTTLTFTRTTTTNIIFSNAVAVFCTLSPNNTNQRKAIQKLLRSLGK